MDLLIWTEINILLKRNDDFIFIDFLLVYFVYDKIIILPN